MKKDWDFELRKWLISYIWLHSDAFNILCYDILGTNGVVLHKYINLLTLNPPYKKNK